MISSERLVGTARLLVLSLVAGLVVLFPVVQVQPAMAAIDTNHLNFNNQVCDLTDAGYEGTGAEEDPYKISDSDSLWEIADCDITTSGAAHFHLTRDITVSEAAVAPTGSPIGQSTSSLVYSFSGELYGNGHSILGISISSSVHGVGLFGYLHGALISNLNLSGEAAYLGSQVEFPAGGMASAFGGDLLLDQISSSVMVSGYQRVGGLLGGFSVSGKVTIVGSSNYGAITGQNGLVGGLIGDADGVEISSSANHGLVSTSKDVDSGHSAAGGLLGAAQSETSIQDSANFNSVSATGYYVGGLVGAVFQDLIIERSTNSGNVTSLGSAGVGGLVGTGGIASTTSLFDSYNSGIIVGQTGVGGLIGLDTFADFALVNVTQVSNSRNSGDVVGITHVGGLVGYVDDDANIDSSHNTGAVSGSQDVGGLLGYVSGSANVTASHNIGTVSGAGDDVGGLVGQLDGNASIDSSYNIATVSGAADFVGGLVGQLDGNASIDSSYNTGAVSGSNFVGGLVGYVSVSANITSSYNTGGVSGAADYIGGLVGSVVDDANIASSYNTGPVSGRDAVSGLVGYVFANANITSSYNIGPVSASDYVGGLVGYVFANANITSSYNIGPVSASDYVGGLAGHVSFSAYINSSHNSGPVSGGAYVGGLVGYVSFSAYINSSHNSGAVSGTSGYVGGLVGYVDGDANITSSYNTDAVSGTTNFVGGLVGLVFRGNANINTSYNTGAISGAGAVGGLVGYVFVNANINTSHNTGAVSGSSQVGGLVGLVFTGNANINTSYNTGAVSGTTGVDGLAGLVIGTVTTTSAYTSVTSDHVATSTVADMKKASTFAGFDFTSSNPVWGFGSCTDNQGFPMLRVFAQISNYNSVACVSPPPQSNPSPGSTPAPAPVLQPLPEIDQTRIQVAAGTVQLLTGKRFELIRSASINGLPATISQLASTSFVLSIPALASGNYSLDLETSNGRISFQGLVDVVETSLNPVQVGSTFSVITGLNPRSSWLNKTALAELEEIFTGQSVVTCIAYNDRPGVIARKKALSRAMHACRIADQLGLETRVFVYGKAPELADTVKILFR